MKDSCKDNETAVDIETLDCDIETLEARGHWATMELLEVVKFHLPCYKNTVKIC